MHAPTTLFSKLVNDATQGINAGIKIVAARTAAIDRERLLKGGMVVTLAIGTFAPMVFSGATAAIPVAQASLAIFTGLLIATILL